MQSFLLGKRRTLAIALCVLLALPLLIAAAPALAAATLPAGYVDNGLMAYGFKTDFYGAKTFDVQGIFDGDWKQTTYGSSAGYRTHVKFGAGAAKNISLDGAGAIASPTDAGQTLNVSVDFAFTGSGENLAITHTVHNPGAAAITYSLGVSADVQIGSDDGAPVEKIKDASGNYVGFKMVSSDTRDKDANGKAAQLTFTGRGAGGTDVDSMWFGPLSDRTASIFGSDPSYDSLENTDSAMSYSWQDRTIQPGETQTLSVLMGVGIEQGSPVPPIPTDPTDPPPPSDGTGWSPPPSFVLPINPDSSFTGGNAAGATTVSTPHGTVNVNSKGIADGIVPFAATATQKTKFYGADGKADGSLPTGTHFTILDIDDNRITIEWQRGGETVRGSIARSAAFDGTLEYAVYGKTARKSAFLYQPNRKGRMAKTKLRYPQAGARVKVVGKVDEYWQLQIGSETYYAKNTDIRLIVN